MDTKIPGFAIRFVAGHAFLVFGDKTLFVDTVDHVEFLSASGVFGLWTGRYSDYTTALPLPEDEAGLARTTANFEHFVVTAFAGCDKPLAANQLNRTGDDARLNLSMPMGLAGPHAKKG